MNNLNLTPRPPPRRSLTTPPPAPRSNRTIHIPEDVQEMYQQELSAARLEYNLAQHQIQRRYQRVEANYQARLLRAQNRFNRSAIEIWNDGINDDEEVGQTRMVRGRARGRRVRASGASYAPAA